MDRVLGSLSAQGAMGTVTATASLHDSTGRRETAQVSASTSDQTPAAAAEPPAPTPTQPLPPTPQPTPSQPPTTKPAAAAPPPSTETPPTLEDDNEEEEQGSREEQREKMQEYRTQKSIRNHVKTAYNCLQYADKVLLRYKVSPVINHAHYQCTPL